MMTSEESPSVLEKLIAILRTAASLGMIASLNLETRNGKIHTTLSCEELRVPEGKPSSKSEKKKRKSKGSLKRSKKRMEKYQQGFKKDNRMDKEIYDIGSNKSISKAEVKPVNKQAEDGETNEFLKERLFICEKCNYQCTRSETLAKHINTKHESQTHDERVCPICDVQFFSPDDVVSHFRVEHMKKLKCDKCSSNFDYNYELDNHIIKNHGEKPMPRKEMLYNLLTEKALKDVKERHYNLLEEAAEKRV